MNINKAYAWGSTAAVVMVIITGLILGGSPKEQRLVRLDEQRVSDLRSLSYYIESYVEEFSSLPLNLEVLVNGRNVQELPRDPLSNMQYTYSQVNATKYRLCADFDAASEREDMNSFWYHDVGYYCFQFDHTLDKGQSQ